jgi:starch synthase
MYIAHLSTELNPIAKVGGLADVVYGLSKQLVKNNHQVEIYLPKYDCIDYGGLRNLKVEYRELWSYEGPYRFNNTIWSAEVENLKIFLLEPHHPSYYFSRGFIYGAPDDNDRFIYFSRAVLEYLYKSGKRPDILHLHDWPTALAAPLYRDMYIPLGLRVGGTVLTLHNMEHQGKCAVFNLTKSGLRGEVYLVPEKMQDTYDKHTINLLKGGIVYSDAITTVSPAYEKEIKTAAGGCGLDKTLVEYEKKLKGILNGIDETFWNPETDVHLVKHYPAHPPFSKEKMEQILQGKAENRKHVRTYFGLQEMPVPLVIAITRLVPQKGPELIRHALLRTLEKGGQFILLGSSGMTELQASFAEIKKNHPKRENFAFSYEHNEALAHLLFAAGDMIVIPSLFEPCGLTQMNGLRYGTVPIVRNTGGLSDTVFDLDTSSRPREERNGYSFDFPDADGVNWALDRALACYSNDPSRWQQIIQQGMTYDYSWAHTAPEYTALYQKILSKNP